MFLEFPKSLYLRGDVESEHVIVRNADEEADKRAQGFQMAWGLEEKPQEEEPKRRPGRPKKVIE